MDLGHVKSSSTLGSVHFVTLSNVTWRNLEKRRKGRLGNKKKENELEQKEEETGDVYVEHRVKEDNEK